MKLIRDPKKRHELLLSEKSSNGIKVIPSQSRYKYDPMPPLVIENNKFKIEEVLLDELVRSENQFPTPLYVYSKRRLIENYLTFEHAFSSAFSKYGMNVIINYACKANSNPTILRILLELGANIDAVTVEEVKHCMACGYEPNQIFYTGVSNSKEDINWLLENGVQINFDAIEDLKKINKINLEHLRTGSFRVIPNISAGHHHKTHTGHEGSKFGVPYSQIVEAYAHLVDLGVKKFGIHCHIGSGSLEVEPFIATVNAMMEILTKLKKELGIEVSYIDFGGGFGVPYRLENEPINLKEVAESSAKIIHNRLKELGYKTLPEIHYEPGRYIVCDASVILTRVNTIKRSGDTNYALVDASMATLIRPAMYDSYHHILSEKSANSNITEKEEYCVAGRVCESGDVLNKRIMLPKLSEGDILIITNAGAYGYQMALATYNGIGLPAQVMISEKSIYPISNPLVTQEIYGLSRAYNYMKLFNE
ncbi:MAG: diaminopimelate decarboxylase [Candidatus Micrarchaeota archaeon]|nr:diaminopimelate decarboxylase [Candidatus Micrarchaeota archaeon]